MLAKRFDAVKSSLSENRHSLVISFHKHQVLFFPECQAGCQRLSVAFLVVHPCTMILSRDDSRTLVVASTLGGNDEAEIR
jgi:hypothetical protein